MSTAVAPGRAGGVRRPWWRLGVVSTAAAGLVLTATVWDGALPLQPVTGAAGAVPGGAAAGAPTAPSVPVGSASLACPGPELLGAAGSPAARQEVVAATAVAPARLGAAQNGERAGQAALSTAGGAPALTVPDAGAATSTLDTATAAVVEASGDAAPGVVGGQLGLSTTAGSRGLSLTACTAPTDSQWLVGGGAGSGRTEQLVLTNPTEDAVTVEVEVWGARGPVTAAGGTALVVPGRGRTVHLLDALAPGARSPVVRVRSSGGPVVAHLGEHHRDGTTDLGAELVTAAAAPATDLVLPALPPWPEDGREVVLRLAAPGEEPAVVEVTALTAEGAVPLAAGVTRVKAGHTVDVPLPDLPEGPVALRVRSDTPVTAGARLELLPAGKEPLVVDDAAATTATPDAAAATATPDAAAGTAGPGTRPTGEPLVRPAGELAWVAATTPSRAPVGLALPATDGIPGRSAVLAVTVLDATDVRIHLRLADGSVRTEDLGRLPNDTTRPVELPPDARGVWVAGDGAAGVVASVVLAGADVVGPYLAAATLPPVPWERSRTEVLVVAP